MHFLAAISSVLCMLLWAPPASAATYYDDAGFIIQSNCAGCPKGEKGVQLHPAVLEVLLAEKESTVRAHFEVLRHWAAAGRKSVNNSPSTNTILFSNAKKVYDANKALIDGLVGSSDVDAAIAADERGVAFARAVAQSTAAAGNAMLAKKGWIQWMGGARWENAADEGASEPDFRIPVVFGSHLTLIAPKKSENTVTLHIWGKGMITLVRKAIATYDLSGVEGAWDPGANLTFDDVAAGMKRTDGDLVVDFDETWGIIAGAHGR